MGSESPELEMIRGTVRQITKKYDAKYWREKTMAGEPVDELWDAVVDAGFFGIMIPEEYGGSGLGVRALATVMEEFCTQCVLPPFIFTNSMAGITLSKHGTEEQKRRYLPPVIRGEERFSFSITEPDAGTNSLNIKTLARRDGDDFVINGQKIWSSNIDQADNVFLVARTEAADKVDRKQQGMTLFIVPQDSAGLSWQPIPVWVHSPPVGKKYWKVESGPVPSSFSAFYDNVRVPAANVLGKEGEGFRSMFDALNPERILAAMFCVGIGRWALQKGVEYARERKLFGDTPIGAYQGVAHPMAIAKTHLELAALMARHAAEQFDAGGDAREIGMYCNMAKYAAAEAAIDAVDIAIQVHGGLGHSEEVGLTFVYPHVRLYRTTPVAREMVLNHIAEYVLGLPRSY
jgi:alkylation response protein AidB-like acyl-CoA dehydrogenase